MRYIWIAILIAGGLILFNETVAAILTGDVVGYFSSVMHAFTFASGIVFGVVGAIGISDK